MKIKTAAIILIVASGLVLVNILLGFRNFGYNPVGTITGLLLPIALLILGISLIGNKPEVYTSSVVSNNTDQGHVTNVPSVGDWLVIFLVTIIPLIGLIFLIIWANDRSNMSRKNYAVATLIWWLIAIVISVLLFTTVLSSLLSEIF